MTDNSATYSAAAAYKEKLHKYVSSLNSISQPAKRFYSESAQCLLESSKKRDSTTYCSTCQTTNPYQWRPKLSSRRRKANQGEVRKQGISANLKLNTLVLKCVVCHSVIKYHERKLKS